MTVRKEKCHLYSLLSIFQQGRHRACLRNAKFQDT